MKIQKAKRKAAGKVFFFAFAAITNISYQLTFNHLEWGEDIFTPGEKELVERMRTRLHKDAELCRQMGHRLCG